ncbi:MAG: spondin domain-containing protein [Pseudomonadota bacterium]
MKPTRLIGGAILCAALASPAAAAGLRITIQNFAPSGGLSLTPVYTAFHNGSVDLFDAGSSASAGIEEIAELGSFGTLMGERLAIQADSQGAVVTAGGPPTIDPGETGVTEVDIVDPAGNRFFSFFSMIVPTNDTFFGNDDATAFELFDAAGNFLGPQTIEITSDFIFDAGTEANDFTNGPAFVVGADATAGAVTSDPIAPATDIGLSTIAGTLETPAGLFDPAFASIEGVVASITVEQVAPVPLPATAWMLLAGVGGLAVAGRRRKARAA